MEKIKQESKSMKKKSKDPIAQILDENNTENIFYPDVNNVPIEFEQVALIPLDSTGKLYTILIPVTPMENVEEGEGVLFEVDEEDRKLIPINDNKIIDEVLEIYQKLIDEGSEN